MPRVPLDVGLQMLVAVGLEPDTAIAVLDDETKRTDGKLDLWCNGNRLQRLYVRQHLHFSRDGKSVRINPVGIGWKKPPAAYVFELDAAQIKAVIAGLSKPGRPWSQRKRWAVAEIRQMMKDGKEVTAGALREPWEKQYGEKIPKKQLETYMRQFRRWIAGVKKDRGGQK
jgi:hypothetical protein